ncbi:hypothetical protein FQR65_LT01670 [Abscondita terminalis]|nr:hypothetical protein FQR65_LT01670 [Abscondita terminalis]
MKILLLILLLSSALSKKVPSEVFDVWSKITDPYLLTCAESANASLEQIRNMLKHVHVPNNPQFHDFIKCIYEHLQMLRPDGSFSEDVILTKATYMTRELTQKCIEKSNSENNLSKKSYILCDCIVDGLAVE